MHEFITKSEFALIDFYCDFIAVEFAQHDFDYDFIAVAISQGMNFMKSFHGVHSQLKLRRTITHTRLAWLSSLRLVVSRQGSSAYLFSSRKSCTGVAVGFG